MGNRNKRIKTLRGDQMKLGFTPSVSNRENIRERLAQINRKASARVSSDVLKALWATHQ